MAEMKHPHHGSVINVRDDSVDRFAAAGYEPVSDGKSAPRADSKTSTAKKSTKSSK